MDFFFQKNLEARNPLVLCIGDLMVDYIIYSEGLDDGIFEKPEPAIGGTGINAAKEFKKINIDPVVFGKVGNDPEGKQLVKFLRKNEIPYVLDHSSDLHTGNVYLVYYKKQDKRLMIYDKDNTNDYDLNNLKIAVNKLKIRPGDIAFLMCHPFANFETPHSREIIDILANSPFKIIIDIVPHNIYVKRSLQEFNSIIRDKVDVIISEYFTLMNLIGSGPFPVEPTPNEISLIANNFAARMLVLRYGGQGSIDVQLVIRFSGDGKYEILEKINTGYSALDSAEKRSFGDVLTARFVKEFILME
ncbi:MAG: carbohydrate kinase family protein [Bacteroidota bacterium]